MTNQMKYRPVGTHIGHPANCNCEETCKPNRRFNDKLIINGARTFVTRDEVQPRVQKMIEKVGGTVEELSRQTGISRSALMSYSRGGSNIVPANTARKLSEVNIDDLRYKPFGYPKVHFDWRIRVLGAQGYPMTWVCEQLGITMRGFHLNRETVNPDLWFKLDKLWIKYSGRMASTEVDGFTKYAINMAKSRATKLGFRPLAAYDSEFDPQPADTSEAYQLIRDDFARIRELVSARVQRGINRAEIAAELGPIYRDVKDWDSMVERVQKQLSRQTA